MRQIFGFLVTILALAARPAGAVEGPWAEAAHVSARLVSASTATGDQDSVNLGLEISLQPGWKAYWRSPGDAGLPTEIEWDGSSNLAGIRIDWPVPHRFSIFGMESFGYKDHLLLPLSARLEDPFAPLSLKAMAHVMTCETSCVMNDLALSLDLPAGAAEPAAGAGAIDAARRLVPRGGERFGLAITGTSVAGTGNDTVLTITARSAQAPFAAPDAFVEAGDAVGFTGPELVLGADGATATLTLKLTGGLLQDESLDGREATITLVDGDRFMEEKVTLGASESPGLVPPPVAAPPGGGDTGKGEGGGPAQGAPLTLLAALGAALLGGLILNLMPCVLPVLSIKLLKVVGHGGSTPHKVRVGFLVSAAGIIVSFLALALALVALKAAGGRVMWGMQFQHPLFLLSMVAIITLFAANLFGLYEIRLPRFIADIGARHHGEGKLVGHFFTGAMATLLATPCSAPFLGTAITFALGQGAGMILLIFLAMGLGLALPYLAVAAFPRAATILPRPGLWMVRLRQVLGLALVGTAAWLLRVLADQLGSGAALLAGGLAALLLAAAALHHRPGKAARGGGWAVGIAALLALLLAPFTIAAPPVTLAAVDGCWKVFDESAIAPLVTGRRTVFVDITASWCLTCKANKKFVLDRDAMKARLCDGGVVAMRGDLTRPDPALSAWLSARGRDGIPFNAVYGPGAPEGIILPEILTDDIVRAALDRAG